MGKQKDNTAIDVKLELRRRMLAPIWSPSMRVLDCCQGEGVLWRQLRKEYGPCEYMGVDKKKIKGKLKIDSLRLISEVANYDVYDVDTYGSPWRHWERILGFANKPIIVFLTCGNTNMYGVVTDDAMRAIGIPWLDKVPQQFRAAIKQHICGWMLGQACGKLDVVKCLRADNGRGTEYYGISLDPKIDTRKKEISLEAVTPSDNPTKSS